MVEVIVIPVDIDIVVETSGVIETFVDIDGIIDEVVEEIFGTIVGSPDEVIEVSVDSDEADNISVVVICCSVDIDGEFETSDVEASVDWEVELLHSELLTS